MQTSSSGIELIKRFEGFRGEAYRCPANVWTIGYGHTEAAGPPRVRKGDRMSREEAETVLRNDLAKFEIAVTRAVTTQLTAQQFSALVSFCYNVGPGAFRSSSVLKAVNARDFGSVPRRLMLWVKAGGRVLPGLVKRRQTEVNLWLTPQGQTLMAMEMPQPNEAEIEEMDAAREMIDAPAGKSFTGSSTNIAGGIAALLGLLATFRDWLWELKAMGIDFETLKPFMQHPWFHYATAAGIGGAVVWIWRERMKKSAEEAI